MAKLKYSFDDYIANPSGRGSAVTVNRDNLKITYQNELNSLESRLGKITYEIFKGGPTAKPIYYFKFKIPSNSTKGFYNDVVIELTSNSDDNTNIKNIRKYTVKFFANDSNFMYTYAYTYKTHGVLIADLEKKLPFRCINQKPTMRNPDNAMGYNKNIYYSYLVMERDGLFEKDTINRICKTGGIQVVKNSILSHDKREQTRCSIESERKAKEGKERNTKIVQSNSLKLLGDNIPKFTKLTKIINGKSNSKIVKKSKISKKI